MPDIEITPPVFRWDAWPEGLLTEKQLRAKGLLPGPVAGLIPYRKSKDSDGYLRVYKLDEATTKPPLSEARQAALAKMKAANLAARTCVQCGAVRSSKKDLSAGLCERCDFEAMVKRAKREVVLWARQMIERDVVVLDTETSGTWGDAEILAISVIDKSGAVLIDSYVKPGAPIVEVAKESFDPDNWKHRKYGPGQTAFGINGITNAMVADAPSWPQIVERLRPLLAGKTVVIYNAEFDHGILDSNCKRHGLPKLEAEWAECLMLNYAAYHGDWNDRHGDYRWQKLSTAAERLGVERGDAHTAAGDCYTSLGVLKALAAIEENEGTESAE